MKGQFLSITALFVLLSLMSLKAQPYVYFVGNAPIGGYSFGYLNLATCENCVDFVLSNSQVPAPISDVVPLPNGQLLLYGQNNISIIQPPDPTPIVSFTPPNGSTTNGAVLTPSGTIYYATITFDTGNNAYTTCLNEYDPATNSNTVIGCAENLFLGDFFFWEGTLYAFGTNGQIPPNSFELYSLTLGNPLLANSEITYDDAFCGNGIAAIPGIGIFTGNFIENCGSGFINGIFDFDLDNNSLTFECDISPWGFPYGLSEIPPSFPPPPDECVCPTAVGGITSTDTILCAGETLELTFSGGNFDPEDVVNFILFSDLADTLGSVLITNPTPSFSFSDPPLAEGVLYYTAAVAGDALPDGSIDLSDPCLDISNVISVIWNLTPSVTFAVANPDLCAGTCLDLEVTLEGTPPFNLQGEIISNGTVVGTFDESYDVNNGNLEICAPAGVAVGSLSVQATALDDAFCECF